MLLARFQLVDCRFLRFEGDYGVIKLEARLEIQSCMSVINLRYAWKNKRRLFLARQLAAVSSILREAMGNKARGTLGKTAVSVAGTATEGDCVRVVKLEVLLETQRDSPRMLAVGPHSLFCFYFFDRVVFSQICESFMIILTPPFLFLRLFCFCSGELPTRRSAHRFMVVLTPPSLVLVFAALVTSKCADLRLVHDHQRHHPRRRIDGDGSSGRARGGRHPTPSGLSPIAPSCDKTRLHAFFLLQP